jgi:AraC family transcriptional regulator
VLSVTPERFEDGKPMLLAGLRRRHQLAAAEPGIAEQWREFLSREPPPARVDSHFYGVMCGSDGVSLEYMCGVEVESFAALAPDVGRMRVPPQRYAVFLHPEHSPLRTTWQKILAWLSSGSYESTHRPDFERYRSPPDATVANRGVEVWVGVVERPTR